MRRLRRGPRIGPAWPAAIVAGGLAAGTARAVPLPPERPSASTSTAPLPPERPPTPAPPGPVATPLPPPRPEPPWPQPPRPQPPRPEPFGPPEPSGPPEPLGPPAPPATPAGPVAGPGSRPGAPRPAVEAPADARCGPLLAEGKVVAERAPPLAGPGGCGIPEPVTLTAIVMRDGRRVPLAPPVVIRCDMAERLADWIRDDVPAASGGEGDLLGIGDAAAYACRGRNNVPGARLSEHARGDAFDLVSLRFSRRSVALRQADAHPLWAALKVSACARFTTVLGPGSDGFHQDHLHLDLEARRGGGHLCRWDDP